MQTVLAIMLAYFTVLFANWYWVDGMVTLRRDFLWPRNLC